MLDYIQNNNVSDSTTKQLNGFVNYVKSDPFVQEGIMTLGEHCDMEREKGREEGRAEGRAEGKKESIFKVLENLGKVDDDICNYIDRISDLNELDKLLLAAAKATDIQEFKSAMK
jgi:predicted transposase YdaD